MKTRFLLPLWLTIICALSVFSCAPELAEERSLPVNETIDPEIIALIEEMGFKTDDIYVTDDAYWVERDIVIPKERLEELKKKPKTRQNYYGEYNLVDRNRVKDVKIAIQYYGTGYDPIAMVRYNAELKAL